MQTVQIRFANKMKIIVDAFGGDNAPLAMIQGSAMAVEAFGVEIILVGDEQKIKSTAQEYNISLEKMTILHTSEVMQVEDDARTILKEKKSTSMGMGLEALANGEGDAFVSAGSTAALTVGATFIVKRMKGIKRPAIASAMPSTKEPFLLLDCGANEQVRPEVLVQFGLLGHFYMKHILHVEKPRVALANIGTEENKGMPYIQEAYQLMKEAPYHFVGNIEAREIPNGGADVVVADGFTGNMLLKMYEGTALAMMKQIKGILMKNITSKIGALLLKGGLTDFKTKMDYTEYGGAALLGLSKIVVKAHGSSNAKAFKNSIRQAVLAHESGMIKEMEKSLITLSASEERSEEE